MQEASTCGLLTLIVASTFSMTSQRLVQIPLPTLAGLAYPRGADGLIHQCAWCRRVLDRAGRFRIWAESLLQSDVSHGMCSRCAPLLRPAR
ncbi:MAG: hypothetical protein JO318_14030 [Chloroflexi bacterium]|nr:hypothetical protein [Chloroflexota bacterium]